MQLGTECLLPARDMAERPCCPASVLEVLQHVQRFLVTFDLSLRRRQPSRVGMCLLCSPSVHIAANFVCDRFHCVPGASPAPASGISVPSAGLETWRYMFTFCIRLSFWLLLGHGNTNY